MRRSPPEAMRPGAERRGKLGLPDYGGAMGTGARYRWRTETAIDPGAFERGARNARPRVVGAREARLDLLREREERQVAVRGTGRAIECLRP